MKINLETDLILLERNRTEYISNLYFTDGSLVLSMIGGNVDA